MQKFRYIYIFLYSRHVNARLQITCYMYELNSAHCCYKQYCCCCCSCCANYSSVNIICLSSE